MNLTEMSLTGNSKWSEMADKKLNWNTVDGPTHPYDREFVSDQLFLEPMSMKQIKLEVSATKLTDEKMEFV
jgi:hypothetical protein